MPAAGQPEETRGEIAYLNGRARQLAGDPDGAFAFYAQVTEKSRFWAQAVYLSGLIEVERGHCKEGENLFCKVADPARSAKTAPFFADEKFFAVRDLARLALGRVAHEQYRFDDARYYYYLVPQDSERLAEALYESATGRYEKKDYEAARELLDELERARRAPSLRRRGVDLERVHRSRALSLRRGRRGAQGLHRQVRAGARRGAQAGDRRARAHALARGGAGRIRRRRGAERHDSPTWRARSPRWCASTRATAW